MPHLPERPSDTPPTPPPAGSTAPPLPTQPHPPAPINPVSLLVKVRDDPASSSPHTHAHAHAGPSRPAIAAHSDAEKLRASVARQAANRLRAEKWADRMMEETLDRVAFKRGVRYLSPLQYSEIQHERHLNHLCSYPLCPNPPERPYSTHRRIRISTTKRSVRQVQGNEDEGFCSKRCRIRSVWVERWVEGADSAGWRSGQGAGSGSGTGGGGGGVEGGALELVEEMEERGVVNFEEAKHTKGAKDKATQVNAGAQIAGGRDTDVKSVAAAPAQPQVDQQRPLPRGPSGQSDIGVLSVGTKVPSGSTPASAPQLEGDKSGLDVLVGEQSQPTPGASKGVPNPTIATKPSSVPGPSAASLIEDLVGNLTIHERPTPRSAPVPPSLPPATSTPRTPGPAPAQAQAQAQDEAQDEDEAHVEPSSQTSTNSQSQHGPVPSSSQPTPTPLPPPQPLPQPASSSSSPKPPSSSSSRHKPSLLPTPTKLVSSILSSSRQLGPIRQLDPDSEPETSEMSDWERHAQFDEDEETRELFEMEREGREIMERELEMERERDLHRQDE